MCKVPGCVNENAGGSLYCQAHKYRLKKWGSVREDIPLRPRAKNGEESRGRSLTDAGYILRGDHKHEHIFKAEQALGKQLPPGAQVHHVDGNGFNNASNNLVICPTQQYHFLLHIRQDLLKYVKESPTESMKGIYSRKHTRRLYPMLQVDGKIYRLGSFLDLRIATQVRLKAVKEYLSFQDLDKLYPFSLDKRCKLAQENQQ